MMVAVRQRIVRTAAVTGWSVRRRDAQAIFGLSSLLYLVGFLVVRGELRRNIAGSGSSVTVVSEPFSRMFEPGPGPFTFEPIAMIELGTLQFLFSPLNIGLAGLVAILVGLNLSLSYLAIVQPKACGLGSSSGVLAAVPALISGSACCAPVILLVLGIGAGGMLLTVITWLYPLGVVLLLLSATYLATRIEPAGMDHSGSETPS